MGGATGGERVRGGGEGVRGVSGGAGRGGRAPGRGPGGLGAEPASPCRSKQKRKAMTRERCVWRASGEGGDGPMIKWGPERSTKL